MRQGDPSVSAAPARTKADQATPGRARLIAVTALGLTLGLTVGVVTARSASAADNPYQRGPDPTTSSVSATTGPFATAQTTVPAGNGFNGGTIYYPTDTSHGTWGAVAIVPGYSALFASEEAWMGPRLASFGFVVIGIETNTRTDAPDARATELLAALDYLTQKSTVKDRVDPSRLAVMGHSAGGAGTLMAAARRPSLKAAIGLAPGTPGTLSVAEVRVPTLIVGGQTDPTVTPSYLDNLYAGLPSTTPSAYTQLSGADHLFFTRANSTEIPQLLPWMKIFIDNDTRYSSFMCPSLKVTTGVSRSSAKCGLVPSTPSPAASSNSPSSSRPSASSAPASSSPSASNSASPSTSASPSNSRSASSSPSASPSASVAPGATCQASYRTASTWAGGYQGEVTVTAGTTSINGWTVQWTLGTGQNIIQVWNATLGTSGTSVTVTNASYNGGVLAGGSTTFGFLGGGAPGTPAMTCSARSQYANS